MTLKIAIVGAGTAGLAIAAFLSRDDHDLTIFEQFETPHPIGAGLLLQPTGLAVLAALGLAKGVIDSSAIIRHLYGRGAVNKRVVFDIGYGDLAPGLFGVGIHRGTLFSLLYANVMRLAVPIVTGTRVASLHYEAGRPVLTDQAGASHGPFDLVIDAHGIRSCIRDTHAEIKRNRVYPYGAIWGVCRDQTGAFASDTLTQRYQSARHMIGVLPVGRIGGDACNSVAFFWSMPVADYPAWKNKPLAEWGAEVVGLWPETSVLLDQIESHDDLTFSTYSDIVLKRPYAERIAFIGDAAHCTSPQLGQGANLALLDAMVLANCLRCGDITQALRDYARARRRHVGFYQMASRWLTPFFQSNGRIMPAIRDHGFALSARIPYFRTQMLQTLAGLKTGLLTHRSAESWRDQ